MTMSHDIGAYIAAKYGGSAAVTAGGAGDATEYNGPWTERPDGALSCAVYALFTATLAATATLSIAGNIQDASDGSGTGAADFGAALANGVVATGGGGGTTETGAKKIGDFNLSGARKFIRAQTTPDLSAGSVDTARVSTVVIFGGQDSLPA